MKIIEPKINNHFACHLTGALFLILNCFRYRLFGYRIPLPFSERQIEHDIDYDFTVVENWLKNIAEYTADKNFLKGKTVLELGPGSNLGIGLILLAMGVEKYIGLDVNFLVKPAPMKFYQELLKKIKKRFSSCNIKELEDELIKGLNRDSDRLAYIVDPDFNLSRINDKIDLIFSQAAFEHFQRVEETLNQLSAISGEKAVLVTEIDLQTHTSCIKNRDPLNIYRYGEFFYNLFKFKGSPNRVRAFEYENMLKNNGWQNVEVTPLTVLHERYLEKIQPRLSNKFRKLPFLELGMLSVILKASKK